MILFVLYLNVSQCIFDTLNPGKVNKEPSKPHHIARKNFTTILEAGPLHYKYISSIIYNSWSITNETSKSEEKYILW